MTIDLYDREGNPISVARWDELLGNLDYKMVRQTQIGPYWVSTVWLGLDHNYFGDGPPLIFETMVFGITRDDPALDTLGPDIDVRRYFTEEQAIEGHEEMCTLVRATTLSLDDLPSGLDDHEPRSPHE
jgi:hypothetical protein